MPFIGGFRAVGFTQSVRRYPAFIEDLPAPDLTGVVLRDGTQDMSAPWDIGAQPFTNSEGFQLNDNAALSFGDANDSVIAYDGTDTLWNVAAVGLGHLQIHEGNTSVGSLAAGDILVIGGDGGLGNSTFVVIAGDAGAGVKFGDAVDSDNGSISYDFGFGQMLFTAGATLMMSITSTRITMGETFGSGFLAIDQKSVTGAMPVVSLDQADVSEEMMEFICTIGVGNAIEAVGAKTLTPTHFLKVTIPGSLTRYFQVGTIA